ncbi:MAG: hypothetical protein ACOC6E_01990 [Thermodesulfobacteriota bacterium]
MLRSVNELINSVIEAQDGEIGRCKDFLFDDRHWAIRYMVADTRKWLPGRKVLVWPGWIESVDWASGKVAVKLTVNAIKDGPEYDPTEPINREYEAHLYDYYGRPHYWE